MLMILQVIRSGLLITIFNLLSVIWNYLRIIPCLVFSFYNYYQMSNVCWTINMALLSPSQATHYITLQCNIWTVFFYSGGKLGRKRVSDDLMTTSYKRCYYCSFEPGWTQRYLWNKLELWTVTISCSTRPVFPLYLVFL